jgi:hypothetical protein
MKFWKARIDGNTTSQAVKPDFEPPAHGSTHNLKQTANAVVIKVEQMLHDIKGLVDQLAKINRREVEPDKLCDLAACASVLFLFATRIYERDFNCKMSGISSPIRLGRLFGAPEFQRAAN